MEFSEYSLRKKPEKYKAKIIRGPDPKRKLTEATVLVPTPEADYRIIYGFHNIKQNPEDLGDAHALALELAGDYFSIESAERLALYVMEQHQQYREIVKEAKNKKIPLFFVDIPRLDDLVLILNSLLIVSESLVGLGIISSLIQRAPKPMTRRDFIKILPSVIIGSYLSSHIPGMASTAMNLGRINEETVKRKIHRFLTTLNEKTHPETYIILLTLRNYIIAQKLNTIAQMLRKDFINKKPQVAIVIGASHIGIETALQESDDERKTLLTRIFNLPITEMVLKEAISNVATIAWLEYDEKLEKWVTKKIFFDPVIGQALIEAK